MRAGPLRRKITIQNSTCTQDAHGEQDETWATYCIRQASVRTISASEKLRNDIDLGDETVIFTIRSDSKTQSITKQMRVSFRSRVYNIEAVRNVEERDRMMELTARTIEERT